MAEEFKNDLLYEQTRERVNVFSRSSYLICLAGASTNHFSNIGDLSTAVHEALKELMVDSSLLEGKDIEFGTEELGAVAQNFQTFIIRLLIVDLSAILDSFLNQYCGLAPRETISVESAIRPRLNLKHDDPDPLAIFKQLVMLEEVRNALVHGNGAVSEESFARLKNAHWTEDELKGHHCLVGNYSLNDVFLFKRAVRTITMFLLQLRNEGHKWSALSKDS